MKTVNLTHYDLDGVTSGIVISNFCEGQDHHYISIGYEAIETQLLNITAANKDAGTDYVLFVTDLCVPSASLEKMLLNDRHLKQFIYIDHHPRQSNEVSLQDIKDRFVNFDFDHQTGISGAALSLKWAIANAGEAGSKRHLKLIGLKDLVRYTDVYDIWRLDNPLFMEKSFPLNDIFWALGFDKFHKLFYNGYEWTNEIADIQEGISIEREKYLKTTYEEECHISEINGKKVLIVLNPAGRFGNEWTLWYPDFDVYLILKSPASTGEILWSCRSKNKRFDVGKVGKSLEKRIKGLVGGGHPDAGGFRIPSTCGFETFFDAFLDICEKLL